LEDTLVREHVKVEVALEILSMCKAIAISNKDNGLIKNILELEQKVYIGNIEEIEKIIEVYGQKVKNALGDKNE
jgi:hypothetical protein